MEALMVISFIGNRFISDCADLSRQLYECIMSNMPKDEPVIFFYGGYGAFDKLCLNVCREIKKGRPDCEIIYITPYITESQQRNIQQDMMSSLYDSVIYPPLESTPPRFAIVKRNEWMVDQSDLIISYVRSTCGGAYKALRFAEKRKKKIISLIEPST